MRNNKFIDQSQWNTFINGNASFMRKVDEMFIAENKDIFPDSLTGKSGKLVLPLVATLFAIGYETLEDIATLPLGVSKEKYEPCFHFLKKEEINRDYVLVRVIKNWANCPPVLRNLFLDHNPKTTFPNIAFNPNLINFKKGDEASLPEYKNNVATSLEGFDIAFAKFINHYMIKFLGHKKRVVILKTFEDLYRLFDASISDQFVFNGVNVRINRTQLKALIDLVKEFARENKTLFDINVDRIFLNPFIDILDGLEILFPTEESFLSERAQSEITRFESENSRFVKQVEANPVQPILTNNHKVDLDTRPLQSLAKAIQTPTLVTSKTEVLAGPLTSTQRDLILFIINSLKLDETQKSLLKMNLTSKESIDFFLESL
ncbi:MAG: hypothetical protein ACRCXZ_10505 [Patescibacteria group bacterium]